MGPQLLFPPSAGLVLEAGGRAGTDAVRQLAAALQVEPADLMRQLPEG